MLAVLGTLVQEFVQLPFPATANPVPTEAFFQAPAGGLWQARPTSSLSACDS